MLKVKAVGEARLPVPGFAGRFVGREKKSGAIIAEGVLVPADSYYLRALARGDIALAESSKKVSS